jgi:hypothetical protein
LPIDSPSRFKHDESHPNPKTNRLSQSSRLESFA